MNRRFRMISLMSEALSLELEDVLERDMNYEKSFRKEFSEEIRFLMHQEEIQRKNSSHSKTEFSFTEDLTPTNREGRTGIVKDIYRSLAKHTHPDIAGPGSEEEFKEIQSAYSDGDLVRLLAAANRKGIAPNLDESDLDDLQEMLDRQKSTIDEVKQTVRWQWGTSEHTDVLRSNIRQALGIHPVAFHNWKQNLVIQERKLAKERAEKERRRREKIEKKKREERKRQAKKAAAQSRTRNNTRARDLERARKKREQK